MQPLKKTFEGTAYASAQQVLESVRVPSNELTKFIDANKIADQHNFEGQQRSQFIRQSIEQAKILEAAEHSALLRRQYCIS